MKQREIKFKVWDISKKVFIPDDVYALILNGSKEFGMMIKDWENYQAGEYLYPNAQTLIQYTGLKDKNGKEIYEGDIFCLGDAKILYVCDFDNGYFGGMQQSNKSRVGLTYWQTDIEIIGNIFENPELLTT